MAILATLWNSSEIQALLPVRKIRPSTLQKEVWGLNFECHTFETITSHSSFWLPSLTSQNEMKWINWDFCSPSSYISEVVQPTPQQKPVCTTIVQSCSIQQADCAPSRYKRSSALTNEYLILFNDSQQQTWTDTVLLWDTGCSPSLNQSQKPGSDWSPADTSQHNHLNNKHFTLYKQIHNMKVDNNKLIFILNWPTTINLQGHSFSQLWDEYRLIKEITM